MTKNAINTFNLRGINLCGIQLVAIVGLCLSLGIAGAAMADERSDPQATVQVLSNDLVALIEGSREHFSADPDDFHEQLKTLMEPIVAFNYIAKNVMGAKYYRQASKEQFSRFENNFKDGLVKTYAKGFFSYEGEEVIVHPAQEDYLKNKKVTVVQEIKTETVVKIAYTMGYNKEGQWKLLNMVVNGVNLGQVLHNQFQQAMQIEQNLDSVIDAWADPAQKSDVAVTVSTE